MSKLKIRYIGCCIAIVFCVLFLFNGCYSTSLTAQDLPKEKTDVQPTLTASEKPFPTSIETEPKRSEEADHEKGIKAYRISDSVDSIEAEAIETDYDLPGYQLESRFNEEAPQTKTISFNGRDYTGTYRESEVRMYYTAELDKYRVDDRRIYFSVNHETGELTEFDGALRDDVTSTAEECSEAADQIARQYIDLDEFQKEIETNEVFRLFDYTRYIGGVETAERLCIAYGSAGGFAFFDYTMQGAFDEYLTEENSENTVDIVHMLSDENALTLLENKIKSDYSNYASHTIRNKKLTVLEDGSLGIVYIVHIDLDSDDPFNEAYEMLYLLKYD